MNISPLNVHVFKTSVPITVSAANGGAGQALPYTKQTLNIVVRNIDNEDCEYQVGDGPWLPLGFKTYANLNVDLSTATVNLRKAPHGRDTSVVLDAFWYARAYSVGGSDGDTVAVGAGTPVESAGVHYNNTGPQNVGAFNQVLARRGISTLSTPGQYIIGGEDQGGLVIPRNSGLLIPDDGSVEIILADQTFEPLIRTERQFDVGIPAVGGIAYSGSGENVYGTITAAPEYAIHLKHPKGSWIGILGLDLSNQANRGYQGVYQVSSVGENTITYEMTRYPPTKHLLCQ